MSTKQHIPCNICEESDYSNFFSAESVSFVKCNSCGLVYANPRPAEKELEEFYSSVYHDCREPEINRAHFTRLMLRRLNLIEKFKAKGRVLEIGCGVGYFLLVAREKGWDAFGVDISKWASGYAREVYRLKVHTGTLETAGFSRGWFDAVLLNHTLEHLPDPTADLKRVYKTLKPGGIVVVGLPNSGSLKSQIYRASWPLLMPGEHLYQFTAETLCRLLKKAGFKVITSSTVSGIFDFGNPSIIIRENLRSLKLHNFIRDGFHYTIGKIGYGEDLTVVAQR